MIQLALPSSESTWEPTWCEGVRHYSTTTVTVCTRMWTNYHVCSRNRTEYRPITIL